jgi:hypothetical protein
LKSHRSRADTSRRANGVAPVPRSLHVMQGPAVAFESVEDPTAFENTRVRRGKTRSRRGLRRVKIARSSRTKVLSTFLVFPTLYRKLFILPCRAQNGSAGRQAEARFIRRRVVSATQISLLVRASGSPSALYHGRGPSRNGGGTNNVFLRQPLDRGIATRSKVTGAAKTRGGSIERLVREALEVGRQR